MHSFFAFCVVNDLLRKNPMDALKKPKTPDIVPTDYFLPAEFEKIVAATEKYEYGGGNDNQHRGRCLRALTLLMRWSGLAILDATSLERERLSKMRMATNRSSSIARRPACLSTSSSLMRSVSSTDIAKLTSELLLLVG
jgi:site-specific recombinase XerD